MAKTKNILILIILFYAAVAPLFSQETERLDSDKWEKAVDGVNYYERTPEPEDYSEEKEEEKEEKKEKRRNSDPIDFEFPTWAMYLVSGIIILLLVFLIISSASDVKSNTRISGKNLSEEDLKAIEENPFENDLERLIHEALVDKKYKLAIRLQFIYVIRILSEKNQISWKKHKTNRQYLKELKKEGLKANYLYLNRLYETIWFGEDLKDSDTLNKVSGIFNDSISHLKSNNF